MKKSYIERVSFFFLSSMYAPLQMALSSIGDVYGFDVKRPDFLRAALGRISYRTYIQIALFANLTKRKATDKIAPCGLRIALNMLAPCLNPEEDGKTNAYLSWKQPMLFEECLAAMPHIEQSTQTRFIKGGYVTSAVVRHLGEWVFGFLFSKKDGTYVPVYMIYEPDSKKKDIPLDVKTEKKRVETTCEGVLAYFAALTGRTELHVVYVRSPTNMFDIRLKGDATLSARVRESTDAFAQQFPAFQLMQQNDKANRNQSAMQRQRALVLCNVFLSDKYGVACEAYVKRAWTALLQATDGSAAHGITPDVRETLRVRLLECVYVMLGVGVVEDGKQEKGGTVAKASLGPVKEGDGASRSRVVRQMARMAAQSTRMRNGART